MLCDGPALGGKVSSEDGSVDSLALEEFHLIQKKFLDIIRAKPEKAIGLNEKFRTILKEEEKEEEGNQFPVMNNQDGRDSNQMRVSQLGVGQVKLLHKRAAQLKMKMAKKKPVSKRKKNDKTKKKDQNVKSKKGKSVKSKVKRINKRRKLDKKAKHISNKNNNLERKRKKKRKLISQMKKMKQKRKQMQQNREKCKFLVKSEELENCTSLWAEFTNVGFGVATTLKKQVMNIS